MARNLAEEERRELVDRLEGWSRRLKQDHSLPWIGMGFIKDLDLAIEHMGGTVPAALETPQQPKPELEFDL